MAKGKPVVVVTRQLPREVETRMMELFEARLNAPDNRMSAQQIIDACDGADVLVPTVTDRIDADLINNLPDSVELIANFGVGVNHIDLEAATAQRIVVTNTPGVLTDDTADMTACLLLAAPRRLVEGERLIRSGKWDGWAPTFMIGHRISGKRLGIIGMGRIGQAVARRVQGFGMTVHYHNRRRLHEEVEQDLEATYWGDLDQMLAHMDFISINCPHTKETHHLLNANRLALLKPHAFVVNTARGEIIDEAAMAQMLANGEIAGAGLDVYEREPEIEPALLDLDNVVLAPHLGSATHEGRIAMGEKVIVNIKSFVDDHRPPDRVYEV
ncbi:MAG: D-glycerate dehydrogenase [Rhodospirillaceae bacterium]|nr:D-glycerate dehydrogenase [Rhodospirillaceae bacterium]RPG01241.1 MAG: D-glycerate dehydrogenase [Rhodospirillaceae bacterium TMED63]RZO37581.1 MAG: D-glycerate dehydrogenase [Rhodospirillaceae bacterium]|tara:strand:+ start:151 stop:1131 length:981 start_codon:yes stop_codon:yes gene_type:complete